MSNNGGGDQLARGMVRAQFCPAEGVTQEKWDDIFKDFDADKFRDSDASGAPTGDDGPESGESPDSLDLSDGVNYKYQD